MASSTAARMALLVMVAPETVSIFRDWLSTMAAGMRSRATPPMEGVSFCSTTFTAVMASLVTVTSTFTSPIIPAAEAV